MNGRNLDYGKTKSDAGEGKMMKTTLLTMAKDMYNLYTLLQDNDDLPQWCHYKLARSSDQLSSITDYLSSKIAKACIDNDFDEEDLKILAKKAMM